MKKLARFIFELGHMRRIKHEGWRLAGVPDPDSIAEHSLRAAQLGYVLAKLEGYENPYEVVSMVVFHDIGEIRVGDVHKLANRYVTADENRAVHEQTAELGEIGASIFALWETVELQNSEAGKLAFDADKLEQAFMAREYIEQGFGQCQDWIDAVARSVTSASAKKLIAELQTMSAHDWWHGLKKH